MEQMSTLEDTIPDGAFAGSDHAAEAGEPLPAGSTVATEDEVVDMLRTIYDPEIPVDIHNLGLIYKIDIAETGDIGIDMTLTAPACPVAGELPLEVAETVAQLDGAGVVSVRLVWDPPWTQERMSEVAKVALGWF